MNKLWYLVPVCTFLAGVLLARLFVQWLVGPEISACRPIFINRAYVCAPAAARPLYERP